jgi:hypothetical protein
MPPIVPIARLTRAFALGVQLYLDELRLLAVAHDVDPEDTATQPPLTVPSPVVSSTRGGGAQKELL